MTTIPPLDAIRLFRVKLEPDTHSNLELMAMAKYFGRTANDVSRIIVEQWARDSEKNFSYSYELSIEDAMRQGYYSNVKSDIRFPFPRENHVYVGLRGLSRYLVEKLPTIVPVNDRENERSMMNGFYRKSPEAVIATILDDLTPAFVREINEIKLHGDQDDDSELTR